VVGKIAQQFNIAKKYGADFKERELVFFGIWVWGGGNGWDGLQPGNYSQLTQKLPLLNRRNVCRVFFILYCKGGVKKGRTYARPCLKARFLLIKPKV
jgi:hypothetical protein